MTHPIQRHTITIGVLAVSFAVGAVLGRVGEDGEPSIIETREPRSSARLTALDTGSRKEQLIGMESSQPEWRAALRTMELTEFTALAESLVERLRRDDTQDYKTRGKISELLEVWAEREPTAALAWYENGMPRGFESHERGGFFLGWGRSDPEAALAYIESRLEGSRWANDFNGKVLIGVAETDPDLALRLLSDGKSQQEWERVVFAIGRYHPESCADVVASLDPEMAGRREIISAMLKGIDDLEMIRQLADSLPEEDRKLLWSGLQGERQYQAEVEGLSGDEFLKKYREADSNDSMGLLRAMAEIRPISLAELLATHEGELPGSLYTSLGSKLRHGVSDQENYRALLAAILSNNPRPEGAGKLMEQFGFDSYRHPEGLKLLEQLQGDARLQATAALFKGMASQSVDKALENLEKVANIEARLAAKLAIAEGWVRKDAAAAIAWAETATPSERPALIAAALPNWTRKSPIDASEWVAAISQDDPDRSRFVGGLVQGLDEAEQIGEAVEWLESVPDEAARESIREQVRDGVTEAGFEQEIAEMLEAQAQGELDADEGMSAEQIEQYRRLYFGP